MMIVRRPFKTIRQLVIDKTTFEPEDNTRKKGDIDKRNDMGQTQSDAIDANRLLAVTKDRLWSKDDPSA